MKEPARKPQGHAVAYLELTNAAPARDTASGRACRKVTRKIKWPQRAR